MFEPKRKFLLDEMTAIQFDPNDSSTDSNEINQIFEKEAELDLRMFSRVKEPKDKPTSNSSSESDQKREKTEGHKDTRRREMSTKCSPRHDQTTISFKAARKKEDLRGGGSCGPFLKSYLNSQRSDNHQVPSSDSRRSPFRRDGNKTDSGSGTGGALSPREAVVVRETKASRLRAASRVPAFEAGSPSPKSFRDAKPTEKDAPSKAFIAQSAILSSPGGKNVDKSLSRKSHLNRSHTSEGVYDDVFAPGGANVRRRRSKNASLEASPGKTITEKIALSPRLAMGNTNGAVKDSETALEHSRRSPLAKSSLNTFRRSPDFLKANISKKRPEPQNSFRTSNFVKSESGRSTDHRVDKSKQVDIATRAEILAASTLKMINRLDEINKSRRAQDDSLKKSLPLNSVISSENSSSNEAIVKTVPSPDKVTAKVSSDRSRLVRPDKPSPKKSPEKKKPEIKPSILKGKPSGTFTPCGDSQKPVSILKRKSLSQDEAQSCSPPVTFSPSVFKKETDPKRQGILKKRRSLDENEVLRRRSYSPDTSFDFKSILKSQRRSSMEELTRRSRSPDCGTPPGILKRKSSREEETEEEPQGILKRKSLPCLNSYQHVKISENVAAGVTDVGENVRPILKKKSSSEEHSTSDPSLTEVPKSILKKKTNQEADENEEKPMKPILKSARGPSMEEPEGGKKTRALIFHALDEPKPILKRSGEEEEEVVLRRVPSRSERPHSSSDIDSELSAIFLKRRSLEFQPVCPINFDLESQRSKRASSNERLRGSSLRRPLSVAEKITNLENFLEVERVERERRNSPPETSRSAVGAFLRATSGAASRAAPDPSSNLWEGAPADKKTNEEDTSVVTSSFDRVSPLESSLKAGDDSSSCSFVTSEAGVDPKVSSTSLRIDARTDRPFGQSSFCSADSEQVFLVSSTKEFDPEHDTKLCYSVDSCGRKISSLSLQEVSREGPARFMDPEDLLLLQRSGSVSAKTSVFKEIEKKVKAGAAEDKTKKILSENAGINRRQEKKLLEFNAQRYHTQPLSAEEVELAVRKSKINAADKCKDGDESHEDELCTMSYKDRLRLFESTLTPKFFDPTTRKRGARHRTQPVTTDEVETAKSQRPPASSLNIPSAQERREECFGPASLEENIGARRTNVAKLKSTEEKSRLKGILKNINPTVEIEKPSPNTDSSDSEEKGFSKIESKENFQCLKKFSRKVEKETVSELKGILKQPSLEKKTIFGGEEEFLEEEHDLSKSAKAKSLGANLAAILQKVEPIGRGREKEVSQVEEPKAAPKYAQNPAIASFRTRNSSLIVKSQSHSSVSSVLRPPAEDFLPEGSLSRNGKARDGRAVGEAAGDETDESPSSREGLRRSVTQPLGPSEEGTSDDMSGASIRERLARLKRSGELDWQKRKSHVTNLEDELSVITSGNYLFNEHCFLRDKDRPSASHVEEVRNSSILADRLGKLDAAKEGWKKRIQPSDAVRFSVEGKMLEKRDSLSPPNACLPLSPARSPLAERKKRSPKASKFRSKQSNLCLSSVPSSPIERLSNPIARSISAPGGGRDGLFGLSTRCELNEVNGAVVTVPKNDDETFTSFFDGVSTEKLFQERLEIRDEDLDAVSRMKSSQLLVQKKCIKTQRRRATVKNPVKSLAARLDLQRYTEIKTGIAEKELKRMKIEKAAKNSTFAIEALAGLASQEDFTAVSLKKASEGGISFPDAPFKDLMLLQVKGRRHVQTRLIEPVARNVNAGDCFILVTPNKVFHFVGEFANVIEKSRGTEICLQIQQKGDLGCSASSVITIGEGGRATEEQVREFWRLLGGEPGCEQKPGNLDEDELFESALIDTNMVYEVVEDELVPVEVYWGSIPKIELLNPNKILVFDFGSEFYVWNGKNVNLSKRKVALKLAKELWEEGFDYRDCDLCPLTAASQLGGHTPLYETPESEKAGPVRPEWALFAKITQNMETVLFREKFLDWPDYTRVIRRGKNEDDEQIDSNGAIDVKPCDAKEMLGNVIPEPDLVLEGNHLGRGIRYFDEETRRCSEITTQDVTVWHVNEYEYSEVQVDSVGQFHMEDSYVVRWHYNITITGRELSGQPSKHLTTGRNRYAYFFWQGSDSPVNDKGAAACLTVELDKEHGPQVRVVQGFEPPAFLNLFGGKMVIHKGRRCSQYSCEISRLFICRGVAESELVLFEVPCSMRQLRTLASFILVNRNSGKVIVWHGGKSSENARKNALVAAKRFQPEIPEFEFKAKEITVVEELEGSESQEFIRALGGDNRQLYFSFLQDKTALRSPRLFHLTSVSGEFLFNEISSPHLTKDTATPLPFLQSDLYSASQPALFLFDSSFGLWLWQGWWEEKSESERGSGYIRFQAERRAAMLTAMAYWSLKYKTSTPKAYLIWAGLEPLVFTNQFPFWTDRDDVAEINMKDGRKPGETVLIKAELARLTQSTYPLAQLQNRPLPDGVNPTSLEDYLEPQCFPDVFGMTKEEFLGLPTWKKKKLKQDVGLF